MGHFRSLARKALSGVLVAVVVLAGASASASGLVVFQTSVPGMEPGQVIDGTKPLLLEDGHQISLIAANGQIIDLKGPYHEAPDPTVVAQTGVLASLKALASTTDSNSRSFGVSRSATNVIKTAQKAGWVPDPWLIDVTRAGNQCVQAGQSVVFWRPEKSGDLGFNVLVGNNAWEAETRWPNGADRLASAPQMPLVDGETYTLRMDGSKTILRLHVVPSTAATQGMQAAWMNAKGCKAQTVALLSAL